METRNPLSKRIKRQVTGRVRDFFAVTIPGLEKLCFDELMSLPLSMKRAMVVPGGVEFKGRVRDCYLANLNLRTASRILMRVGMFKATNFTQLRKRLTDFPWELFVAPGIPPRISVSSRHSRLYHTEAISERFMANISERLANVSYDGGCFFRDKTEIFCQQHIFVRVSEDRFTLSVDSSGENLYKRGIKKQGGEAPLRETLAAAALKLAKYDGREPLIDPMCGTGTFSLEGAMMSADIPPGYLRVFAFMEWPSFRSRQWKHIRKESEKHFRFPPKNLIFASDKDEEVSKGLEKAVSESLLSEMIRVSCRDFFDFSPSELVKKKGLVVLNPPYGRRLGTPDESRKLFRAISEKLRKDYRHWKIALIAPDKRITSKVPFRLKAHRFCHGGLKLTLLVGRINA